MPRRMTYRKKHELQFSNTLSLTHKLPLDADDRGIRCIEGPYRNQL